MLTGLVRSTVQTKRGHVPAVHRRTPAVQGQATSSPLAAEKRFGIVPRTIAMNNASKDGTCAGKSLASVTVVLVVILGFLFWKSFQKDLVHFSNDGRWATLVRSDRDAYQASAGSGRTGIGLDYIGTSPISITWSLLSVLGPVNFAKFYPPITLFILGLAAWTFFARSG